MANKIQIKRSVANSVVTGLANGELAFTANGKIFYIGSPVDGTSIRIGGEMVPGTLSNNQALVANTTGGIDKIIVANLQPSYIYANGASGTNGQLLVANNTGGVYWLDQGAVSINVNSTYSWTNVHTFSANLNANVVNASSFTIGTDFSANSSNLVFTNGGITANAFFGNGASLTSVDAYTIGGNNVGDIVDNAQANIYANSATYTGNNEFQGTNTVFSSNVTISGEYLYANTINAIDATISGNLVINGSLTTVNTTNLIVSDNMIALASNNEADSLDSGFYVRFDNSGNTYSGIARDHSDGIFKLFETTTEPTTSVDFTTIGTLQSYINSGIFVSNSTTVAITANSVVNVNIVANTLILSSPLLGNSGGTGINSYTNNDILVANSSDGFNKLSLGTDGYVLQSNGTALIYDSLDGGTF